MVGHFACVRWTGSYAMPVASIPFVVEYTYFARAPRLHLPSRISVTATNAPPLHCYLLRLSIKLVSRNLLSYPELSKAMKIIKSFLKWMDECAIDGGKISLFMEFTVTSVL